MPGGHRGNLPGACYPRESLGPPRHLERRGEAGVSESWPLWRTVSRSCPPQGQALGAAGTEPHGSQMRGCGRGLDGTTVQEAPQACCQPYSFPLAHVLFLACSGLLARVGL